MAAGAIGQRRSAGEHAVRCDAVAIGAFLRSLVLMETVVEPERLAHGRIESARKTDPTSGQHGYEPEGEEEFQMVLPHAACGAKNSCMRRSTSSRDRCRMKSSEGLPPSFSVVGSR